VRTGLKPKDALHLACAVAAGCRYFLTTDDGILSHASGVRDTIVVSPTEFLRIERTEQ
jgi:predicted nucleic acid-binding protein